jgi:hypothetical protein
MVTIIGLAIALRVIEGSTSYEFKKRYYRYAAVPHAVVFIGFIVYWNPPQDILIAMIAVIAVASFGTSRGARVCKACNRIVFRYYGGIPIAPDYCPKCGAKIPED